MRRRFLTPLVAICCLAGAISGPAALADDSVPPSVAVASGTATRGTVAQVTPTEPPPPTTAAPTTVPGLGSDRSPTDVPLFSGSGRRVVYSKGQMRLWLIDGNENLLRTYLVSGRRNQPDYGEHRVYSRSTYTCNIDHDNVCMRWMVRFANGPNGDNIGFHEIPRKDGVPVQTDAQLGIPLSSGCVRQSTADAQYMWGWAYVGTKVVVVP